MTSAQLIQKTNQLNNIVGNTPLLAIDYTLDGEQRRVFAKAEHMNMTGSIKDRMALHVIQSAYAKGGLQPGDHIIEATSGNTGIAFSGVGRALGHPVTIFMPDWLSTERKNIIRSLGAEIHLVSKEEGGFLGSIEMTRELADKEERTFLPSQFDNQDNVQAHASTTGPEIWWQLRFRGLAPDAFVAGVGTGGTVMGVGSFLKSMNPEVKVHPLEPSNSPTMSTGHKVGKHRIQGISDEFVPSIVDLAALDQVIAVDDGDSIRMAQMLGRNLGLGVGISSGANFLGAVLAQQKTGPDSVVVTVFSDDNKKYLSTDLMREEPVKPTDLSSRIELLGFRAIKRVCKTCCDPSDCGKGAATVYADEASLPQCPHRGGGPQPIAQ